MLADVGFVGESLIADGSGGGVGFFEGVVDEVFVEADGDAGLPFGSGSGGAILSRFPLLKSYFAYLGIEG